MSLKTTKKENLLIKVFIIGDSGAHKEMIHIVLMKKLNQGYQIPRVGIDFTRIFLTLENIFIKFQLWHTAGQERFKSFTDTYFKGAQAILAVFSASSHNSFDFIVKTVEKIKKMRMPGIKAILLLGFMDEGEREVTIDEARDAALNLGITYIEAKFDNRKQIKEALRILGNQIIENFD